MLIDFKLPNITDNNLDDAKERKQIKEYLIMLTRELRYVLSNLSEDNLSSDLSGTITGSAKAVNELASSIQDVGGALRKVEQNATQLGLSANNQARSCVLTLKMGDTALASVTIQFTANFLTKDQLDTADLNAGNLKSGTVPNARIDPDLPVKNLSGASGTFSSLSSASGSTQLDGSHVASAKLFATGAATAQDGETYYPVYIKANGEIIRAATPAEGG